MHLALGLCYAVLLADGTVVEFRFLGNAGPKGQIVGESPSGSGTQVDLLQLLRGIKRIGKSSAPDCSEITRWTRPASGTRPVR